MVRPAAVVFHFNPRSPRGERLVQCTFVYYNHLFQSTLPAGGATVLLRIGFMMP